VHQRPPLIERAFDLARSGLYNDVSDVARQLKAEGYEAVTVRLAGPSLRKQLRELCRAPRTDMADAAADDSRA
jgi:dienelactone hydrolase